MKKTFLTIATLSTAAAVALVLAMPSSGQDGPPAGGPPAEGAGRGGGGGARGAGGGRAGGGGGAPAAPAGPIARTPDGHPDFSGFWNLPERAGATGIEGPDPNAPPPAARGGGAGRGGGGGARGGGAPGGGGPGAGGPGAGGAGAPIAATDGGGAPAGGAAGGGRGRGAGGPGGGAPGGGAPGGGGAPAAGGRGGGGGNPIIDPPDGRIPYKTEARAKQQDLMVNHLADEPELNCYESGVPHSESTRFGAQIVMAPGYFVQMNEFLHTVRVIPIDPNRKHVDAKVHLFQGDPIGHWEGDTLVVDTTNQNDKTWFDLSGNFKTTNLHVTEKFIPQDANTITYEATMSDPTIYTKDWTARWNLTRDRSAPNSDGHPHELMEFACIEGNMDPGHYTDDQGGKAKQVVGKKQ